MTDRIQVAITDGETKWPSWTKQGGGTTYADAGVDTAEGARAVDAIKDAVHRTYRNEVVGDIGGFGGLFSIAAANSLAITPHPSVAQLYFFICTTFLPFMANLIFHFPRHQWIFSLQTLK